MSLLSALSVRAEAVTRRTYNRPKDAAGSSFESWTESMDRCTRHQARLWRDAGGKASSRAVRAELEELRQLMLPRKSLLAGRTMWLGGTDYAYRRACCQFNCSAIRVQTVFDLVDAAWLLLNGCGVGFRARPGTLAGYRVRIPQIEVVGLGRPADFRGREENVETVDSETGIWRIQVGDSAVAWAKCVGKMFRPHARHPDFQPTRLVLDFSQVRGAGQRLKGYGWVCNGGAPLAKALVAIHEILNAKAGSLLDELDILDVVNHLGTILSSRRSAQACVMDYGSPLWRQFAGAKKDWWLYDREHRQQSNNSLCFYRKPSRAEIGEIMQMIWENGGSEPGIVNADAAIRRCPWWEMFNPCLHPDERVGTAQGMLRAVDLYMSGQPNLVVTDTRVSAQDVAGEFGVKVRSATRMEMTQRSAQIFAVRTAHGHVVRCTANHQFPTPNGRKPAGSLRPGDVLLLQSDEGCFGQIGSYGEGLVLGLLTGDGTFATSPTSGRIALVELWQDRTSLCEEVGQAVNAISAKIAAHNGRDYGPLQWMDGSTATATKKRIGGARLYRGLQASLGLEDPASVKKEVPECVWRGCREMVVGYLRGLYVTDGFVNAAGRGKNQSVSLRLSQANEELLRQIQSLLQNFGIVTRLYRRQKEQIRNLPDGRGGSKGYSCRAVYELVMNRPNAIRFEERVGLIGHKKEQLAAALAQRGRECRKVERYLTEVASVEPCGISDVYCLKEPETSSIVVGGVVTGQCFEICLASAGLCNLVSSCLPRFRNNFADLMRAIYLIARANYRQTCVDLRDEVLQPTWHQTNESLRLCGVSMTGICQAENLTDFQIRKLRNAAITGAYSMADELRMPRPAAVTTIKPEGCRPAEGLVTTEQGILTLEELLVGHPEGESWRELQDPPTACGVQQPLTRSFRNGVAPVYRVRLSYGMELLATAQHPWWVRHHRQVRGRKQDLAVRAWVATRDLRVNDILQVDLGTYRSTTSTTLVQPSLEDLAAHANHQVRFPERMNADLAWLLGFLWGNGSYEERKSRLRFTSQHRATLRKAARILDEQFGLEAEVVELPDRDSAEVGLASRALGAWLTANGVTKYRPDGELGEIPRCVRTSARVDILAFLAGLADADGCASASGTHKQLVLSNRHDRFTSHLQHVAAAVGLLFGRSLNTGGRNRQPHGKHMWLMTLSRHVQADALAELRRHSIKMAALDCEDARPWYAATPPTRDFPAGKVLAIEEAGALPTYDVEVAEEHWFYAGAVRSHNTCAKITDSTEGIHKPLGRHIFNWINFSIHDPLVEALQEAGYRTLVNPTDSNNMLVCFPVQFDGVVLTNLGDGREVNLEPAIVQLERYRRWNTLWADHNVSNTISYDLDELPQIVDWLDHHWDDFISVSWLRRNDPTKTAKDLGYLYLPQEVVTRPAYEEYTARLRPPDWSRMRGIFEIDEAGCTSGHCPVK